MANEERAREVLAAMLEATGTDHDLARAKHLWRHGDGIAFSTTEAVIAMLAFADEAVQAERERCAGIADMWDHRGDISAAIRSTSPKGE
jgi:hypothetical protein